MGGGEGFVESGGTEEEERECWKRWPAPARTKPRALVSSYQSDQDLQATNHFGCRNGHNRPKPTPGTRPSDKGRHKRIEPATRPLNR